MSTERVSKKRKTRSGCSGIELVSAYHVLQKFRETIKTENLPDPEDSNAQQDLESAELDVEVDKDALVHLDDLLKWMDSKIKNTKKTHAFSSADSTIVSDIEIEADQPLVLKDDVDQRISAADLSGTDHFMSCNNMHNFLDMLLHLVARPSEASARTWVDAFLYRASAILPASKQMVINTEYNLAPVSVLNASGSEVVLVGRIDYTVVVTQNPDMAQYFLEFPVAPIHQRFVQSVLGFFVVEAKGKNVTLLDNLSQVLLQLYAAAKKLKKSCIRGTLTNGYDWLFLILKVNANGIGASYRLCNHIFSAAPLEKNRGFVIHDEGVNKIAGILASWIENSSADLLEEDWFR